MDLYVSFFDITLSVSYFSLVNVTPWRPQEVPPHRLSAPPSPLSLQPSSMRTFHLAFASFGRHHPFPGQVQVRAAIHALARVAGSRLVIFGIAAEQVHVVLHCERPRAGLLARALLKSLRAVAGPAGLEPARLQPVADSDHLLWLHDYLVQLPLRAGVPGHPALWDGSPLPDLLGARWVPPFSQQLSQLLPGYQPIRACQLLGLHALPALVSPAQARLLGIGRIGAAAAAAMAAPPLLQGRTGPQVIARRAASRLARRAGLPPSELSWAFGQTRRTAYRLASAPLPAGALEAVQLRLGLEQAAASHRFQALQHPSAFAPP